jgi:diguanylate cyclase (GGDEF)-like protein
MTYTQLLTPVASFVVTSALLWLAGETAATSAARSVALSRALAVTSVALAAIGLWWPAHALHLHETGVGSGWLLALAWVPALALAVLASVVMQSAQRGTLGWTVAAGCATPLVAYAFAMLNAPGMFRLTQGSGGALGYAAAVSATLVLTQFPRPPLRRALLVRAVASVLTGVVVAAGAALSVPDGTVVWLNGAEWLLLVGLIAIGWLLVGALKHIGTRDAAARPVRVSAVDNLTGLPTRLYLEGQMQAAARKCDAQSSRMAVLFVDLDGFKPVNDTYGHSCGDRVLEQVGQRLQAFARDIGIAARVGGDEFLLLAAPIMKTEAAAKLATRLIEEISKPYKVDDREVSISCSVGIALYPNKCPPNKLIARADAAMNAAKRAGGGRYCFYAPEMDADAQRDFDLMRDLRQALVTDELELFYQPKIDARTGKVTAAEALLRWRHPTRGLVMPAQFIPLSERTGLIGPLGNWVIEAACKQSHAWREKGLRMRVAINLSPFQMRQDDIVDRIAEALTRYSIHPSLLTCEITESAAMEDTAATQETFRRLGELGAHLSIDDFGTGYSSLSYLRQLPAEELKIDASFIKDLDHSADARAVVDAVVKLAHALGLKVVAEGVETQRQQATLVELGCDELQGYLFAKPMSARALLLWAMDERTGSAVFSDSLFGDTRQAGIGRPASVQRR